MSLNIPKNTNAILHCISHAVGKPMNQVLPAIIEAYAETLDPTKICEHCKDKASPQDLCDICPFKTRAFDTDTTKPLNYHFEREVTQMKPTQVSVLISKKIAKNFCSWSVSHGVTADLEDHDYFKEAIATLDSELKLMVSQSLPTDMKPVSIPAGLPSIPEAAFTTG